MDPEKLKKAMANMSDEQCKELAEKLDRDLDSYMSDLESKSSKYMDGWNEETWEKEMEQHPFFTKNIGDGQELSPLLQGIQDLKYSPDENTLEELAKNYKEDGNYNFKYKKYRFAVASYSEGLKHQCQDNLLNAQLLTNRAAAQFHLSNYRSSLIDCRLALKKVPGHQKALVRGVECCLRLKRFKECQEICDLGLDLNPKDEFFLNSRSKALNLDKELERNKRKQLVIERKRVKDEQKLLETIKNKGIRVEGVSDKGVLSLSDLEPKHPAALQKNVHFVDSNPEKLAWPVLFLYPEYGETDFIEEFIEDQSFQDHLEVMFGQDLALPPWDQEQKYRPENLKVYFEDRTTFKKSKTKLVEVDKSKNLMQILGDKRYRVAGGTPGFIILVEKSEFQREFLQKYD